MTRLAAWMLVLTALASPALADDRALLVGVGNYQDEGINDLPGVNLDIDMMRDVAIQLGFKPAQIKTLFDQQSSLASVRAVFDEWLVRGTGPGDRVLFYYSGHGAYVPDRNGDETDGRDEVLVLYDAHVVGSELQNVLVDDEFGEWLARLPAKTTYVLIDACHSGSVTKGVRAPKAAVVKYFSYRGVPAAASRSVSPSMLNFVEGRATRSADSNRYIALTAAADNEQSLASPQGSFFTIGVRKAIADGARNKKLSLRDVERVAAEEIARLASADSVHHPQLGGNLAFADANLFGSDTTSPAPAPGNLWREFETLVDGATERLQIGRVRDTYSTTDRMQIEIVAPRPGYLNVITISEVTGEATVLFPNQRESNNKIEQNTIVLPAPGARYQIQFALPAGSKQERNLLVAFVTDEPLNAYERGSGPSVFRELSPSQASAARGAVIGDVGGYAAGKVVYVLR